MNKISAYLKRPASFNTKPWQVVLVSSLLVGFLLGAFQPFGIEYFDEAVKAYIVLGFTLVTAASTAVVGYVFPRVFRKFYDQRNWTAGKSLLNQMLILLVIALGNFAFDCIINDRQAGELWAVLAAYVAATLIIGIIPAVVSTLIVQNGNLRRNLDDARIMNSRLAERLRSEKQRVNVETQEVVLSGSTKESVTVFPDSIIYAESCGNYVKIMYLSDNAVRRKQLRTTISRIEQDLRPYQYILRCHRAYMVNVAFITNVEGNSQGLNLHLRSVKDIVPVSRSYVKAVREKL